MKIGRTALLSGVVLLAVTSAGALAQSGGVFDLSWQTIGGGGGESAGGPFMLSGTIGQPATDRTAGGAYSMAGGYWPGTGQPGGGTPRTPTYLPMIVVD